MPKILVVDDLLSDCRIAGGLLTQDKAFSVVYASNGIDALDQLELHVPDLVLTDLQMPKMNGLELVQRIREDYPLIPTILMTAKGSEAIAIQAIEQGAASYVPKKRLATDLHETVRRVLAVSTEERSYTRLMHRVAETTFVLENDLTLLSTLVGQLRQDLEQRSFGTRNEAIRMATALDEAFHNAFYHGNLEVDSVLKEGNHDTFHELAIKLLSEPPYCDRRITVTARYPPADATFIIRDEGPGFNPDDLPDPTDPEYLERPSGRGLLLMRTFVDQIVFNNVDNEVTLIKHKHQEISQNKEV